MAVVEFIGGPQCGRVQDVEPLATTFYFAAVAPLQFTNVDSANLMPPTIIQRKYAYRLCRRIADGAVVYWYIGIHQ